MAPILALADAMPADLLVMGTHGRGGFERLVLGSFAEKTLRKATCPVLTIPPAAEDPAAPVPVLLQRILCPIDFSPSSKKALTYALSLAQESAASLTLLHVLEPVEIFDVPSDYIAETLAEYRQRLEKDATEELRNSVPAEARNWCAIHELVTVGKVYKEIQRVAHRARRARDRHGHAGPRPGRPDAVRILDQPCGPRVHVPGPHVADGLRGTGRRTRPGAGSMSATTQLKTARPASTRKSWLKPPVVPLM